MVSTHAGTSRSRLSDHEAAMLTRTLSRWRAPRKRRRDAAAGGLKRPACQLRYLTKASRHSASQAADNAFSQVQPSGSACVLHHPAAAVARQVAAVQRGRSAMAALIALTAFVLFAVGVLAGIIGVVCVAIRREETNLTLTSQATDHVTRAGRWLNGVGVRAPHRSAALRHDQIRGRHRVAMRHSSNVGAARPASVQQVR